MFARISLALQRRGFLHIQRHTGGRIVFGLSLSRKFGSGAVLCAVAALAACAAPSSYMGISFSKSAPLAPGANQERIAALQALARRAQQGSKHAQLELGIRFEECVGVPCDLDKAKKLYRKAASNSGGTVWVYSPPVGNGTSGQTAPFNLGSRQQGLAEAMRRLEVLK